MAIALDGIDLAVVGQQTEGLGQLPARQGIGREALVKDGGRGLETGVGQIRIELGQPLRHHHALVGEGLRRQAGDIEAVIADGRLDTTACQEQLAFELVFIQIIGLVDAQLLDGRTTGTRGLAQDAVVDRHLTPAGNSHPESIEAGLDRLALAGGAFR